MKNVLPLLFLTSIIFFTSCSQNKNKTLKNKQVSLSLDSNTENIYKNTQISKNFENKENAQDKSNQEKLVSETFLENMENCIAYSEKFTHPFGAKLTREIVGFKDNMCVYREQVGKKMFIECTYNEDQRKAAVKYFRYVNTTDWQRMKAKINGSFKMDGNGSTTENTSTTTGKGEEVINPMTEAFNTGQCKVITVN